MSPNLVDERTESRPNPRQEQAARVKGVSPSRTRAITGSR